MLFAAYSSLLLLIADYIAHHSEQSIQKKIVRALPMHLVNWTTVNCEYHFRKYTNNNNKKINYLLHEQTNTHDINLYKYGLLRAYECATVSNCTSACRPFVCDGSVRPLSAMLNSNKQQIRSQSTNVSKILQ